MKIIGHTDTGYLCQITEDEIGIVMGYGRYPRYGDEVKKSKFIRETGRAGISNSNIPTNTEIQIVKGLEYIESIRTKLSTVKKTVNALREMADMLESPIPAALEPTEMKDA